MATPGSGYRSAQGKRIPSVTTVLSRFKDSKGLIQWAYRQGREHEHAALTGGHDPGDLYSVTEKAATAGSIAHDLIEQHVLTGQQQLAVLEKWKDSPAPVLALAWNSYAQFQQWWANTRIEIISTEESLVSDEYGYGGTYDALGRDSQGRLVLVDWKTSNNVYSDYLVQLAAYGNLIRECRGESVEGYHLLRVRKETADFSHHYWHELDDGWEAFQHMIRLYDLMYKLGKRV